MQPPPAFGKQEKERRSECEQHYRASHCQADECHEAGAAIIAIARDDVRGYRDQEFEDAALEQRAALTGGEVAWHHGPGGPSKHEGPGSPGHDAGGQAAPADSIIAGTFPGNEFADREKRGHGEDAHARTGSEHR